MPGVQTGAANEVLLLRAPWYRRHRPARPCVKFCCSPSGAVGRAALASCSPIPPHPCTVSLPISWVKARKYMGAVTVSRSAVCKPQQGTDQDHLAVASPHRSCSSSCRAGRRACVFFCLKPGNCTSKLLSTNIYRCCYCRSTSSERTILAAQESGQAGNGLANGRLG